MNVNDHFTSHLKSSSFKSETGNRAMHICAPNLRGLLPAPLRLIARHSHGFSYNFPSGRPLAHRLFLPVRIESLVPNAKTAKIEEKERSSIATPSANSCEVDAAPRASIALRTADEIAAKAQQA
jgi:hypothetical protein